MSSLLNLFPEIAAQWHPRNNEVCEISEIRSKSNKKLWWRCENGHEWQAPVFNRTRGKGCPYCAGYYASLENNLAVLYPELVLQLHPTKNNGFDPYATTPGSERKVWWMCEKGHEWKCPISNRTDRRGGTGCPHCRRQTSGLEIRVFSELKYLFPSAIWGDKIFGVEVDVTIPEIKLAIEVDGSYWHQDKQEQDRKKNQHLESYGYTVVRIREKPLQDIGRWDTYSVAKEDHLSVMTRLVNRLWALTKNSLFSNYSELKNEEEYKKLFVSKLPKISVFEYRPELEKEWNYERNGSLNPIYFSYGSEQKVWWRCSKGHEWETCICKRCCDRSGCPYCKGIKVCEDNCLETIYPEIARQWHPTLNGSLTPKSFTAKSGKKIWWMCEKGHSWQSAIGTRTGLKTGCPECFNLWWRKPKEK